jgi:putative tryptophan/tyrosine transport system substrate-binding protein
MTRRHFIALLYSTAMSWAARAERPPQPVIGFLHSASPEQNVKRLAAFRDGLRQAGFVEGQNVAIEYRWAMGRNDKLPSFAAELIRQDVAVIATPGSTPASVVVKKATTSIPIVFAVGADPVELGLVKSLNQPGGNVTGITSLNADIAAKRFDVLRKIVPKAAHYFAFINPTSPLAKPFVKDLQSAAAKLDIRFDIINASDKSGIDTAFASLPQQPGNVLVFPPDALFYLQRAQIAALTTRYAVPAIFDVRDYVDAGGLVSYGADFLNVMQLAGAYVGRVLKGEKPGDLPVMEPTKYEFVINLKTAKALGLTIPPDLLALTDNVVE